MFSVTGAAGAATACAGRGAAAAAASSLATAPGTYSSGGTEPSVTAPLASPLAGRNSGTDSPRMKTKMKSTATMMNIPPKVMNPTAKRSIRLTRRSRLDCALTRCRMSIVAGGGSAASAM